MTIKNKLIMKLQLFAEPTLTLEQLQKQLLDMQDKQKQDDEQRKIIEKELEAKTVREKELETINQQYYLRMTTGKHVEEKEEDETEIELKEYIGEDLLKLLTPKERELAIEIMNGDDE